MFMVITSLTIFFKRSSCTQVLVSPSTFKSTAHLSIHTYSVITAQPKVIFNFTPSIIKALSTYQHPVDSRNVLDSISYYPISVSKAEHQIISYSSFVNISMAGFSFHGLHLQVAVAFSNCVCPNLTALNCTLPKISKNCGNVFSNLFILI